MVTVSLAAPLTLFTATRENNQAQIQWQTAQEQHSSFFAIERSTDGATFTTIGIVAAAGNSALPLNYSFTDLAPALSSDYYRLRQVDLDGNFTYSPVKLLNFSSTAGGLIWYATGPQSVEVRLQQGNNELYSLMDLTGRTLFVWGEQGFGDALQFARFIPEVARRVQERGKLIYCAFAPLFELFEHSLSDHEVDVVPHDTARLPDFDFHVNVVFLPGSSFINNLKTGTTQPMKPRFALRKISNSNQTNSPEPLGLAGDELLGLAMACSL